MIENKPNLSFEKTESYSGKKGGKPVASFNQLVFLLGAQAMQQLGLAPNPLTDKIDINLDIARFSIDLLEILEEKTKGNLTDDESRALKQLLSELRLNYVRLANRNKSQSDSKEKSDN